MISGLYLLELTAAKNIFDRIRDGPILLNVVPPLNEPDSFSFGVRPTNAAAYFAVEKFLDKNKYTNSLGITFPMPTTLIGKSWFLFITGQAEMMSSISHSMSLISPSRIWIIREVNNIIRS